MEEEAKVENLENNILNEKAKISNLKNTKSNKIISWFKDPYNLSLAAIIILALVIRIYYFIITKNQPLWWDEAEYMLKAKNIAFGTPDPSWWFGRPILFPFLSGILFKLGLGEIGIRFFWVIMSTACIYLVYYIGKNTFSKRIGLIAASIMCFSYIDLFYSCRLLVDLPEIFFVLLAYALFINSEFLGKSKKYIWLVLPVLLVGTLIRFTVGLAIIIILIYLLVVYDINIFKKKEWYISLLISFILFIPYGVYSWIKYHNPLYVIITVLIGSNVDRSATQTPMSVLLTYLKYLPSYTYWILFIFFLVGVILLLSRLILTFDKIRELKSLKVDLFMILAFIIPLVYFGLFVNHFEDRYLAMALSIMFLLIARGLDTMYNFAKKYSNKIIAILLIFAILFLGLYKMYGQGNYIIKDKITSYDDLRKAGLWIKENSNPTDVVISMGMPEVGFYSERAVYKHEDNYTAELETFKKMNASYTLITSWEPSPPWTYEFFGSNQTEFKPVYQSVSTYHGQQMYAIVFKI